jgi:D-3-phosphoglycerate dehydrogenase
MPRERPSAAVSSTPIPGNGKARSSTVVVTDFIERDLRWETEQLLPFGISLVAHQLKHATAGEILGATRSADVVVTNMAPLTAQVIEGWKSCRLVIRHGIGYDNVDLEALSRAAIPLVNIPDYCVDEVADHAAALILGLLRKVGIGQRLVHESAKLGEWAFRAAQPVHRIKGQTLGFVGCGRIGSRLLEKFRSFGFEFAVCDPLLEDRRWRELALKPLSLEELLERSDVVSLHAPLNGDTRGMINEAALRRMKSSAFLVNTARAGLIDQAALVKALRDGWIAGAALDVFEPEPPRPDDPLLHLPNVILTPHLSWLSVEAEWTIRERIVAIIKSHLEGVPLHNVVNSALLSIHRESAVGNTAQGEVR